MTTTAPRQSKTPAQRAHEALTSAERLVQRLTARKEKLTTDLASVTSELTAAEKRRDYAAANPDLPTPPQTDETAPDDDGPHSRACGIAPHDHGPRCSKDCPTCQGKP